MMQAPLTERLKFLRLIARRLRSLCRPADPRRPHFESAETRRRIRRWGEPVTFGC